jgi:hypothetical protein
LSIVVLPHSPLDADKSDVCGRRGHTFDGEQAKIHDETHQTQPQTMPSQLSSPVSDECVTSNRPTEMNLSWNPENFCVDIEFESNLFSNKSEPSYDNLLALLLGVIMPSTIRKN